MTGTVRIPGAPISTQNGFDATFQNLHAVTFETGPHEHLALEQIIASLTGSSGPAAVTLGRRERSGPSPRRSTLRP